MLHYLKFPLCCCGYLHDGAYETVVLWPKMTLMTMWCEMGEEQEDKGKRNRKDDEDEDVNWTASGMSMMVVINKMMIIVTMTTKLACMVEMKIDEMFVIFPFSAVAVLGYIDFLVVAAPVYV